MTHDAFQVLHHTCQDACDCRPNLRAAGRGFRRLGYNYERIPAR